MSLAETIVILKVAGIQHTAVETAVHECHQMTAHSHQPIVWQEGQRLDDITALCMETVVEMAETERVGQEVRGRNLVNATTLRANKQVSLRILGYVHGCTTAQTVGTPAFTLMQSEPHLVGILLQSGHP